MLILCLHYAVETEKTEDQYSDQTNDAKSNAINGNGR